MTVRPPHRAAVAVPLVATVAALAAHAAQLPSFPVDSDHPVTVTGVVVAGDLSGPRAILRLAEAGTARVWTFDAGTPLTFRRAGVGDKVEGTRLEVHGFPEAGVTCQSECRLRMRSITFEDGRKVFLGAAR